MRNDEHTCGASEQSVFLCSLLVVIAVLVSFSEAGWICPAGNGQFNPRFCETGRSLTRLELGVINFLFGTDKRLEDAGVV